MQVAIGAMPEFGRYQKPKVIIHGDQPKIEESVDVSPNQQAVCDEIGRRPEIRVNVRSLKDSLHGTTSGLPITVLSSAASTMPSEHQIRIRVGGAEKVCRQQSDK